MIEKPPSRWQSRPYLEDVADLPCFICGTHPVQASHLKGPRQHDYGGARGRKTHDFLAAPLCQRHHAEYENREGEFSMLQLRSSPGWAKWLYAEEGAHMGIMTLSQLLASGDWELRRRK